MTKVLFRKFRDEGDIIALFPEELCSPHDYSIACYQHIGQHGGAHYDHVIRITVPANESEYADLLAELKTVGYDDLRVMRKCRPDFSTLLSDHRKHEQELCAKLS